MDSAYDKEKILECLFDPNISEVLAELENGDKKSSQLAEKLEISEDEIRKRLSYLLQHYFVQEKRKDGIIIYSADKEKLAKVLEHDKNFEGIVDRLTEMDSYLN